ncbi:MAG: response regulator transcription factor [Candidatus Spechtbacterales bacterium]|nr:response regulator transcription factor [Candidatus Spechtbacterales bacterium]
MKILIVEDEEKLAKSIKRGLKSKGFTADYVLNGEDALRRLLMNSEDYDLVILDLMLPGKNGGEVCKELREKNINLPILVLTARGETSDKVELLNNGADDYLVKPFSFEELFARVNALLRRPDKTLAPVLKIHDITLDPGKYEVYKKDKKIDMTPKEFALLEYLMRNPNRVLTREQILSHLWGFDFDGFSNVVDVHIKNLRKKINDSNRKNILETVRGVGYKIKE